jgi:hypothetical protein
MASAMVCVSLHHPATSGGGSLGLGQFMREVGFCKEAKFRETLKRWNRKEWESEVQRQQMRLWSARSPLEVSRRKKSIQRGSLTCVEFLSKIITRIRPARKTETRSRVFITLESNVQCAARLLSQLSGMVFTTPWILFFFDSIALRI